MAEITISTTDKGWNVPLDYNTLHGAQFSANLRAGTLWWRWLWWPHNHIYRNAPGSRDGWLWDRKPAEPVHHD